MPTKRIPRNGIPTDLITRQEAAKLAGVSERMIDRLAAQGRLKKYRLAIGVGHGGSRIRVSRAEVEKLRGDVALKEQDGA